jgi:flagellar biosynthesis/type III secretory pathway M-ring protein FliF/YscJ
MQNKKTQKQQTGDAALQPLVNSTNQNDRQEQIRAVVADNPELTVQLLVSWIKEQDDQY